jgi:hypothetical protein
MRQLALEPYIPLALWMPLATTVALLLACYALALRRRLAPRRWLAVVALMAVCAAVPLVILLNPLWVQQVPPPAGKPLLTVLVDRSASMSTPDADGHRSRYQQAGRIAEETSRQLGARYEVRLRSFAADSLPETGPSLRQRLPDGNGTDLAAAVEGALAEDRPQGQAMLLLSDGIHNAAGGLPPLRQAVAKARAMAAPIYTTTLGGPAEVQDLEVSLRSPQELGFVGQRIPVVVTFQQRGALGAHTEAIVSCEGKVVLRRDVKLQANGTTEEVFPLTQSVAGLYRYEIQARPLPGEVTADNNTATLLLRVVDQPVRVLLVEGKPYWDTKFLVRTLAVDPSVDLVSVVQLAEGRWLQRRIARPAAEPTGAKAPPAKSKQPSKAGSPPQPPGKTLAADAPRAESWAVRDSARSVLQSAESLNAFQVVILGRSAEAFLSDEILARLKKWLAEADGSLVCFRGAPAAQLNQRLAELMPVRWTPLAESRFRVTLTEAGQALRWFGAAGNEAELAALPSLATTARAQSPGPLAVVLANSVAGQSGQPAPVITYQPVGTGRVVVVEGAGMWRWAFLPPEQQRHDEVYGYLWRSLIRWLVSNVGLLPSQDMALRTDKVVFSTTESAAATLLVRAARLQGGVPQVELTGGQLKRPQLIAPIPASGYAGQFRVPLGRLPEGRYCARALGAADEVSGTARFEVRGSLRERLEVRAQPGLMQWIAEESGGAVLEPRAAGMLVEQFDRHLARSRPERVARTTAWDRWWLLSAAMGLFAVTWGLRRWSGLI